MAKKELKTKGAVGELRTLTGKMKLLNRSGEYLFPVELWLLNDQTNRNNWRYENVEGSVDKFLGKPILTAYLNGGKTVGDGHNMTDEEDAEGNPAPSFTGATDERIVGAISEDKGDVRIEKVDGVTWIVAVGTIYAWYAKEVVKKLREYAEQGREIPVSIETLVSKSRVENRVEVEEEYTILGTTILGDHVTPAVAGARIAALSSVGDRLRELKLRAASYAKQNPSEKGLKKLSVYTKKQCDTLQEKFGNGWRVLGAAEDESGLHVALRNESYAFARCDLENANDAVIEQKFVPCAATVDMGIGAPVDISPIFDEMARLNSELTTANNKIAERDSQIANMNAIENKRRVQAAKDIAKATLAAFNANREEKVAENAIDEVCSAVECGTYTAMTDKDGLWCGDKAVENAVYAVCAREVQKADKLAAERAKTVHSYEKFRGDSHADDGTVGGLLSRLKIRD